MKLSPSWAELGHNCPISDQLGVVISSYHMSDSFRSFCNRAHDLKSSCQPNLDLA